MPTQVARHTRSTKTKPQPEHDAIRILSYAYDVLRGAKPSGKPLTADEWATAERLVEQIADQDQAVPQ